MVTDGWTTFFFSLIRRFKTLSTTWLNYFFIEKISSTINHFPQPLGGPWLREFNHWPPNGWKWWLRHTVVSNTLKWKLPQYRQTWYWRKMHHINKKLFNRTDNFLNSIFYFFLFSKGRKVKLLGHLWIDHPESWWASSINDYLQVL